MAYSDPVQRIRSSVHADGGGTVEFWWMGFPGTWGAQVVKTDEHGMRWTLDATSTHWVTQRIAAGLLNVSVMTINRWVKDGVFGKPVYRNGVSVVSMREVQRIAHERGLLPTG